MLAVTVWMNMPSFYQDGFLHALAATGEIDLQVIFARPLAAERTQLGWRQEARDYPHRFLSTPHALFEAARLARGDCDRLHIVNGIWAEPAFMAALWALGRAKSRFLIHAEAPGPIPSRWARTDFFRARVGQWVAQRAAGILAISHFAVNYYAQFGFLPDAIYPFGYFRINRPVIDLPATAKRGGGAEIVFVGQLIHRKGVDVLLEALGPLLAEYNDLRLSLIGTGNAQSALEKQAAASGFAERIHFLGTLTSDEIPPRIATADLLVLPSRWDGWGLVVNEALSVSVPVIVSDRCGASDLIQHGVNGYVFRSQNADDLRGGLRRFLDQRADARKAMRDAARAIGKTVAVETAARYLIDCLRHNTGTLAAKPVAPWLKPTRCEAIDR